MAMAASSLSSYGGQNVMMLRGDMGSSNSLVTMLTSCNPHVNYPVVGGGGGLEDAIVGVKRPYSSYSTFDSTPTLLDRDVDDDAGDDLSGGGGGGGGQGGGGPVEKKRRLSFDQVRSLERNFEMENKLEPERKMQLAKELGLQPRQVAVWFQNRRARWKTKQLERDYEMLNSGYLKLKADFETALREKDVLKAEVQRLSGKTRSQDSQQSVDSSQCGSESPSSPLLSRKGVVDLVVKEKLLVVEELVIDPESATSSGSHSSELFDAESPRSADSNHPPQLAGYCSSHLNDTTTTTTTLSAADTFTVGPGHDDDVVDDHDDCDAIVAAVKLEDHHGFPVDPSCGYFLPPISDQSVLPWWDWA